ncbi:MAG: hypothetical protein LBN22_09080 [Clostridiales Family XIII bacterium]|jgi:phenylacetate-coenzyme A ligase PaaK-like adenylate-forming protein|nr:hypothetical protein [Clostridiales Family XIII bacterium]
MDEHYWSDGFISVELENMGIKNVATASCAQTDSRAQIEAYQMKQLRKLIAYVKARSPFYKQLYRHINIKDIRTMDDLKKLPLITEDDLLRRNSEILSIGLDFVRRRAEVVSNSELKVLNQDKSKIEPFAYSRLHHSHTSGTHERKSVFFSDEDMSNMISYFQKGISRVVEKGDIVLAIYPYERYGSVGHLISEGVRANGAKCYHEWPLNLTEFLTTMSGDHVVGTYKEIADTFDSKEYFHYLADKVRDIKASVIIAPAGICRRVAEAASSIKHVASPSSLAWEEPYVKKVMLSSEYIGPQHRYAIEKAWPGTRIWEHYASTESGYGIGIDCGRNTGCYCVRDSSILLEIIDGEIVITTLGREATPLIRYRTGDYCENVTTACPLNSPLHRLGRVKDRGLKQGEFVS